MRWASGSGAFESSRSIAFGVGAGSWAAAEGRLVRKPEPAGVTAHGFVTAGFFRSACDPRRGDFAGGGASGGGSTTSVWGGVEAGPECQVGLVEPARLESVGGRARSILPAARQVASRPPGDTTLLRRRPAKWKRR